MLSKLATRESWKVLPRDTESIVAPSRLLTNNHLGSVTQTGTLAYLCQGLVSVHKVDWAISHTRLVSNFSCLSFTWMILKLWYLQFSFFNVFSLLWSLNCLSWNQFPDHWCSTVFHHCSHSTVFAACKFFFLLAKANKRLIGKNKNKTQDHLVISSMGWVSNAIDAERY